MTVSTLQTQATKLLIAGVAILLFLFLVFVLFGTPQKANISIENQQTIRDEVAAKNTSENTFIEASYVHGIPIIPDVPKDAIQPLNFPEYESLSSADTWLRDNDIVLGVDHNGDARAYPIRIVNWHEVINDRVGARHIVITYCPLSGSGIIFDRQIGPRLLTFGNTGALYESGLVMYDRETNSYWRQSSGQALIGELADKQLIELPSIMTTWEVWKSKHPGSVVLASTTGHALPYDQNLYEGYDDPTSAPAFPVSHTDNRLAPKDLVVGIQVGPEFKAYPTKNLGTTIIKDVVGEREVEIRGDGTGSAQAFFITRGTHIKAPQTTTFWFAWAAAHPETGVYGH